MADTLYATLADLKARMGQNVSTTNPGHYDQATDRNPSFNVANDTNGQTALNYAAARINSKLAARGLVTPIDVVTFPLTHDYLRGLTMDFTVGHLWIAHPQAIPTDDIQGAYDQSLIEMTGLANGDCVLPAADQLPTTNAQGAKPQAGGFDRVWTEKAVRGFF